MITQGVRAQQIFEAAIGCVGRAGALRPTLQRFSFPSMALRVSKGIFATEERNAAVSVIRTAHTSERLALKRTLWFFGASQLIMTGYEGLKIGLSKRVRGVSPTHGIGLPVDGDANKIPVAEGRIGPQATDEQEGQDHAFPCVHPSTCL